MKHIYFSPVHMYDGNIVEMRRDVITVTPKDPRVGKYAPTLAEETYAFFYSDNHKPVEWKKVDNKSWHMKGAALYPEFRDAVMHDDEILATYAYRSGGRIILVNSPENIVYHRKEGYRTEGGNIFEVEDMPEGWPLARDIETGWPVRIGSQKEAIEIYGPDASHFSGLKKKKENMLHIAKRIRRIIWDWPQPTAFDIVLFYIGTRSLERMRPCNRSYKSPSFSFVLLE